MTINDFTSSLGVRGTERVALIGLVKATVGVVSAVDESHRKQLDIP